MLSFGFYNSKNKDRRYDAEQLSAIFDGLITDGIYGNYKEAMQIVPGTGTREIVIRPGRAWFNHTWTLVDDNGHSIYLMGSSVDQVHYIYLCVNKPDRVNTIAGYSSMRESDEASGVYFYPLAEVRIPAGTTMITSDMITDLRGSTVCPFVTGILETVSFETIVREVCGENWATWLNAYETGLEETAAEIKTLAEQTSVIAAEANTASKQALSAVNSMRNKSYKWAKFTAVQVGEGSIEWGVSSSGVAEATGIPNRKLYWGYNRTGSDIILVNQQGKYALTPAEQAQVWRQYPFFYGDGLDGNTDNTVYQYTTFTEKATVTSGSATYVYTYVIEKAVPIEAPYECGEFVGIVSSDNAYAYPRDGYSADDGYWYMRFASQAEEVFYDDTQGLDARTVQEAIAAIASKVLGGKVDLSMLSLVGDGSDHGVYAQWEDVVTTDGVITGQVVNLYGSYGDEPVVVRGVHDPVDSTDAVNKQYMQAYVREMLTKAGVELPDE